MTTGAKKLRPSSLKVAGFRRKSFGALIAPFWCMKEPSEKRKRTLELQDRAIRFSVSVNAVCPDTFTNLPSSVVWGQLVRAADSTSNNLCEADDASSDADFLHKMKIALREAKESRVCLAKLRMGSLDHHERTSALEDEARQLASIFATIARNVERRLEAEAASRRQARSRTNP
jgi:four helix bundle protein